MWMAKALQSVGGLFKWGLGTLAVGGGAVVADEALLDGQVRKGIKGYADEVIRDVVDVNNETEIYGQRQRENAEYQTWGSSFLSGIAGFFRLLGQFVPGMNKIADYFGQKADNINREAMQATRDFSEQIEDEKRALRGEAPLASLDVDSGIVTMIDPKAGFTDAVKAGEILPDEFDLAGGAHIVAHGLQDLVVNAGAAVTSMFADDTYSELSERWTAAADNKFIGEPEIESAAGHALHAAAQWGVGFGAILKAPAIAAGTASIVGGLRTAKAAPSALPKYTPGTP